MIVSNNIINEIDGADKIARINLAWLNTKEEAKQILDNIKYEVYLDYPSGRTKPPIPKISLKDALELAKHKKVKYFAMSNVETVELCKEMVEKLDIEFVPKIETAKGVKNLAKMIINGGIKTIMLDKEDLYTNVGCDPIMFNLLVDEVREFNIKILELKGVIFDEYRRT